MKYLCLVGFPYPHYYRENQIERDKPHTPEKRDPTRIDPARNREEFPPRAKNYVLFVHLPTYRRAFRRRNYTIHRLF